MQGLVIAAFWLLFLPETGGGGGGANEPAGEVVQGAIFPASEPALIASPIELEDERKS